MMFPSPVRIVILLFLSLGCTPAQVARPSGRIRVLNLFTVDGGPGPAVDVYAAPAHAGESIDPRELPLIAGVEYAKLSEPISPPANDNVGVMSFFLTGTKTATPSYAGEPVPGHFELDDRAVMLLHQCPDAGTPTVCFDTLFESGPGEAAHPLPRPTSGKAMFYEASAALTPNTPGKTFWWGIGGSCLSPQSAVELTAFEIPAASANLVLILKSSGTATCMETPTFTLPISTTAGRRAWLFMWGSSASDIHASWAAFQ